MKLVRPQTAFSKLIPVPLFAWFHGDSLAGADGSEITTWSDSSGNSRDATQATTGRRPFVDKTNLLNGHAAAKFTVTASPTYLRTGALSMGDVTVFAVVKTRATPTGNQYVMESNASGTRHGLSVGTTFKWQVTGATGGINNGYAGDPTLPTVVSASMVNLAASVAVAGVEATSAVPTVVAATALTIGNRYNLTTEQLDGWLYELVIYQGALTATQRRRVERFLARKYGLPMSVPGTYYVDTAIGNNVNHGQLATVPLATLIEARNRIDALGIEGRIRLSADAAHPVREKFQHTSAHDLVIEPTVAGTRPVLYGSFAHTSGWASEGGGVYSKNVGVGYPGLLLFVAVTTLTETFAGQTRFLRLKPTAGTQSAPAVGEFGYDAPGMVVYVHLPSGADPNTHTLEIPKLNYALQSVGGGVLRPRDLDVYFGNLAGVRAGPVVEDSETGTGNVVATTCRSYYGGGGGGGFGSSGTFGVLEQIDCEGYHAMNDGGNYHGTGTVYVRGGRYAYNGDEGLSAHDDTVLHVLASDTGRCETDHNWSSGVLSVGNCEQHIDGLDTHDNCLAGPLIEGDATKQGGVSWYDSTMSGSVANVTAENNTGPGVYIEPGADVAVGDGIESGVGRGNTLADVGV